MSISLLHSCGPAHSPPVRKHLLKPLLPDQQPLLPPTSLSAVSLCHTEKTILARIKSPSRLSLSLAFHRPQNPILAHRQNGSEIVLRPRVWRWVPIALCVNSIDRADEIMISEV